MSNVSSRQKLTFSVTDSSDCSQSESDIRERAGAAGTTPDQRQAGDCTRAALAWPMRSTPSRFPIDPTGGAKQREGTRVVARARITDVTHARAERQLEFALGRAFICKAFQP